MEKTDISIDTHMSASETKKSAVFVAATVGSGSGSGTGMSLGQDGKASLELEERACQDHQDPEYGPFRNHNLEHVLCARTNICHLLNGIAKSEQLEHDTLAGWLEARVKSSKDRWVQIEEESLYHSPSIDEPMTAKKAHKRAALMAREKLKKAKSASKSDKDDKEVGQRQGRNGHSSKSASRKSRSSKRDGDDKDANFPYEQAQPYDYLFNSKSGDERDKQNSEAILEMVKRDMVPAMETVRNAILRMKQVETEIEARIAEQIAERSRRFPKIISELKTNAHAYKDYESEEEEDLDSESDDDSDSASDDDDHKSSKSTRKIVDESSSKSGQDHARLDDDDKAKNDDDEGEEGEDDEDNDGTYSDNDSMSDGD